VFTFEVLSLLKASLRFSFLITAAFMALSLAFSSTPLNSACDLGVKVRVNGSSEPTELWGGCWGQEAWIGFDTGVVVTELRY